MTQFFTLATVLLLRVINELNCKIDKASRQKANTILSTPQCQQDAFNSEGCTSVWKE